MTAYVVYGLLHQLGNLCPNTFKKLDDDLLQKLKEFLLGDPGLEPRSPEMAAKLMCKMLHSRELSLADLGNNQHVVCVASYTIDEFIDTLITHMSQNFWMPISWSACCN